MFKGRRLVIAGKHKKERVLAPLFAETLGVICQLAEHFDTDTLGTFSGEVERRHDAVTTLRYKCLQAMEMYRGDLGIASEGSFGVHPQLFFVPANEEMLIFIDLKNKLEIKASVCSLDTNFAGEEVHTEEALLTFAEKAQFPSHALILRKSSSDHQHICKGINSWSHLLQTFSGLKQKWGSAYVETDMRAMHNPSRMKVIELAAQKLLEKINACCPQCKRPGFALSQVVPGLPCECCLAPTRSALSHLYRCEGCGYEQQRQYPQNKTTENAMYCDCCNP